MSAEQLVQLDPSKVLADDNSRFGLKQSRTDALASSILEAGGVLVPVEVEPLTPHVNGFTHRLTSGFYRHAAVAKLNTEQHAGLTLPAIVRTLADPTQRLRHQLMENMERENQSPMDQATAIKKLMDAGMARSEIRRMFARPGGRKGEVRPASNAWLNISLRLLDLPKSIQEKIHDGRVGFAAAYELGRVTPDKRAAVLERAEKEREQQMETEEKDEEKYLQAEKRSQDADSKAQEAVKAVESTKTEIQQAEEHLKARKEALKAAQNAPYLEADEKGKKAIVEKMKAAEADVKAAEKLLKDAKNRYAKSLTVQKSAAEVAAEQKAKLEAARKAQRPKAAKGRQRDEAVGPQDIRKAAQAEGASTGFVPLTLQDIRAAVKDIANQKDYAKVSAIGSVLVALFNGQGTPKTAVDDIALVTGERQLAPAAARHTAPAPAKATAAAKK